MDCVILHTEGPRAARWSHTAQRGVQAYRFPGARGFLWGAEATTFLALLIGAALHCAVPVNAVSGISYSPEVPFLSTRGLAPYGGAAASAISRDGTYVDVARVLAQLNRTAPVLNLFGWPLGHTESGTLNASNRREDAPSDGLPAADVKDTNVESSDEVSANSKQPTDTENDLLAGTTSDGLPAAAVKDSNIESTDEVPANFEHSVEAENDLLAAGGGFERVKDTTLGADYSEQLEHNDGDSDRHDIASDKKEMDKNVASRESVDIGMQEDDVHLPIRLYYNSLPAVRSKGILNLGERAPNRARFNTGAFVGSSRLLQEQVSPTGSHNSRGLIPSYGDLFGGHLKGAQSTTGIPAEVSKRANGGDAGAGPKGSFLPDYIEEAQYQVETRDSNFQDKDAQLAGSVKHVTKSLEKGIPYDDGPAFARSLEDPREGELPSESSQQGAQAAEGEPVRRLAGYPDLAVHVDMTFDGDPATAFDTAGNKFVGDTESHVAHEFQNPASYDDAEESTGASPSPGDDFPLGTARYGEFTGKEEAYGALGVDFSPDPEANRMPSVLEADSARKHYLQFSRFSVDSDSGAGRLEAFPEESYGFLPFEEGSGAPYNKTSDAFIGDMKFSHNADFYYPFYSGTQNSDISSSALQLEGEERGLTPDIFGSMEPEVHYYLSEETETHDREAASAAAEEREDALMDTNSIDNLGTDKLPQGQHLATYRGQGTDLKNFTSLGMQPTVEDNLGKYYSETPRNSSSSVNSLAFVDPSEYLWDDGFASVDEFFYDAVETVQGTDKLPQGQPLAPYRRPVTDLKNSTSLGTKPTMEDNLAKYYSETPRNSSSSINSLASVDPSEYFWDGGFEDQSFYDVAETPHGSPTMATIENLYYHFSFPEEADAIRR